MGRWIKYYNILGKILSFFIMLDIIVRYNGHGGQLFLFLFLFILALVNDYLRHSYFYKNIRNVFISLILSVLLGAVLFYFVGGYIQIYMYIILYETILYYEGKGITLLFITEFSMVFFLTIFRHVPIEELKKFQFWIENIMDSIMILGFLGFFSISLFSYKEMKKQKTMVEKLNKELKESYAKLQDQSEQIEELTITKERNRVAQEIHDHLGHSLIALNMNLDVISNLLHGENTRVKPGIDTCQKLTRDSIEGLRRAVYTLKEYNSIGEFKKTLAALIDPIIVTEKIHVEFDINEKIEFLAPQYKSIIYRCIKESMTNSIKHGKCNVIWIQIKSIDEMIYISIQDDGIGCDKLIKGTGLVGIEERVKQIGGTVEYWFQTEKGFKINIYFKTESMDKENDERRCLYENWGYM